MTHTEDISNKPPLAKFENLPTGKPHISFSEMRDWVECSYRHKQKHVNKINLSRPGQALDFGTAIHASCESFLRTRTMDSSIAHEHLKKAWLTHKGNPGFEPEMLQICIDEATAILLDVPPFMDENFPNWEYVDAEHLLYEPIENHAHAFKGFIDGIIKTTNKEKQLYWLIDWKTTNSYWPANKKSDPNVTGQLVLYKNYWSKKMNISFKEIRCAFVLLKRKAKPGRHCEIVTVSVGDVTQKRHLKIVGNMLASVKRGFAIKNRDSCKWCELKNTEHCT
jgi:ATP-dependent exoDNAse (exonuclease V) beta subunit